MILSLCVYMFLAIILWLLAKDQLNPYNRVRKNTFWTWQNVISIIVFAVFYGVRYNVGVDNQMYITMYEELERGKVLRADTLEAGYQLIQDAFVGIGFHYSVFIGLWGALQIGLIYYAIRRNKYLLPLIALFIVLGPAWMRFANTMRQAVVECAFIVIIDYVVKRKLWKYLLGVALCCLVHKSALLLLPFYFFLQKPIFPKNKWVAAACLTGCTIIGLTPTWIHSINFVEHVLEFMKYDTYTDNFKQILEDQEHFRAWGPARAGLWALYMMATMMYLMLRKKYKFNKHFDIYFECFFFGNCLYELFANTNQIFIRPLSYFQSFSVIVVPICLYFLWQSRKQTLYYIMCALAFFNSFWWTIKAYLDGGLGEQAPEVYKFFFIQ